MQTPSSAPNSTRRALEDVVADPAYSARVLAVVQRIGIAADEYAAVALLEEAAHALGADVAAFASFVRDDGDYESYRFLLACDPVWCLEYEQDAWYGQDPWLHYAAHHSEPIRAQHIGPLSLAQQNVTSLASRFGFNSAVIVPAPSSRGLSRLGVLCIGSRCAGYFDGPGFVPLKVAARGLAMELHEWWIRRLGEELRVQARLGADDMALLHCERQGMSTKAISARLGMPTSAIDSRFRRLNQKLGVPNRKAAATLAAEYGLI